MKNTGHPFPEFRGSGRESAPSGFAKSQSRFTPAATVEGRRHESAFTLIELIVVIAIIGILAGLIIPVVGVVNARKQISTAQTQLKGIEAAIDGYKTKLGYYPPDNPNNPALNQLYFELLGTTNNGAGNPNPTLWVTMDGSAQIGTSTTPNILTEFSVTGFANTSTRARSDDQGAAASTFLNNLKSDEIGMPDPNNANVKILVCSVTWPPNLTGVLPLPAPQSLNPWRYVSTHPTNNTASYDLWVDIVIHGKTNRISNWSTQPIKLP
jgi:prepilin-type N-terminal cleavage/methylation domain-containing protein